MWTIFLWACIPAHTYNRSYVSDFPSHYREVVSTWEGKSLDELLLRWGNPYQTIMLSDESVVYEYLETKKRIKVETSFGYDVLAGEVVDSTSVCITRFKIGQDGQIMETDVWGSLCSAWVEPKKSTSTRSDYVSN